MHYFHRNISQVFIKYLVLKRSLWLINKKERPLCEQNGSHKESKKYIGINSELSNF